MKRSGRGTCPVTENGIGKFGNLVKWVVGVVVGIEY